MAKTANTKMPDRTVQKLPNQGDAKPGGATVRAPEKTGNTNPKPPNSGVKTNSIKAPGSGTRGSGAKNSPSRT